MQVFGITGWSGAGKTTLIERLLPQLSSFGLTASVIKHAHRRFDLDRPGKDSYRFREAGCGEVLIVSPERIALMRELDGVQQPRLSDLLALLSPCDIVLVEGYKNENMPKLEILRRANNKPPLYSKDENCFALVTDFNPDELPPMHSLKCFGLDDIGAIAEFIVNCENYSLSKAA